MDQSVAGLIVEPVQGMTGARECSPGFLRAARAACDRAGALLIFDEIQCGAGRAGAFTAAEVYGVTPDVLTLAKGLASGVPVGAMIATSAVTSGLKVGDLGSTFGGGPIACAAGLATLEVFDREDVLANVRRASAAIRSWATDKLPVQGLGLLLGLRMPRPASEIQRALFAHRVLTGTASDPAILRLLPPLTFSPDEVNVLLARLDEVLA